MMGPGEKARAATPGFATAPREVPEKCSTQHTRSRWGAEHWLSRMKEQHPQGSLTGHHAASVLIGRRRLARRARRRGMCARTVPKSVSSVTSDEEGLRSHLLRGGGDGLVQLGAGAVFAVRRGAPGRAHEPLLSLRVHRELSPAGSRPSGGTDACDGLHQGVEVGRGVQVPVDDGPQLNAMALSASSTGRHRSEKGPFLGAPPRLGDGAREVRRRVQAGLVPHDSPSGVWRERAGRWIWVNALSLRAGRAAAPGSRWWDPPVAPPLWAYLAVVSPLSG